MSKILCYLDEKTFDKVKKASEEMTGGNLSKMAAELITLGLEKLDSEIWDSVFKKMVLAQLQTLELSKNIIKCVNNMNLTGFANSDDLEVVVAKKSRERLQALLNENDE